MDNQTKDDLYDLVISLGSLGVSVAVYVFERAVPIVAFFACVAVFCCFMLILEGEGTFLLILIMILSLFIALGFTFLANYFADSDGIPPPPPISYGNPMREQIEHRRWEIERSKQEWAMDQAYGKNPPVPRNEHDILDD